MVVLGIIYGRVVMASPGTIVVPGPGYEAIQEAINAASPGDVIRVANGTYYENLMVNKSVSIIGEDPSNTVIDGGGKGIVVNIISSDVVVSGFTIQNGENQLYPYSGISIFRCDSAIIKNNVLRNNYYGLQLTGSNDSVVSDNLIMNNSYAGMYIHGGSSENVFFENTIEKNIVGSWNSNSSSNTLYHNNFVNNTSQALIFSPTTWDNGYPSGGNYWSDYTGVDLYSGPYQNETGSDGIGDSPYAIAGDRYPLMGMFENFSFTYKSQMYFLSTICNSTILDFQFDEANKEVSFNVAGSNGTMGFCRIDAAFNYTVLVDGRAPSYVRNWTFSRETYTYFRYEHTNVPRKVTVAVELSEGTAPVASFSFIPANSTTSGIVNFTDASYDPSGGLIVAWHWDFGDGATSILRNPAHKYASAGTYTVTLTVIDSNNLTDSTSKTIVISTAAPPSLTSALIVIAIIAIAVVVSAIIVLRMRKKEK
jgi:parallel beta-helix repeat protein